MRGRISDDQPQIDGMRSVWFYHTTAGPNHSQKKRQSKRKGKESKRNGAYHDLKGDAEADRVSVEVGAHTTDQGVMQ